MKRILLSFLLLSSNIILAQNIEIIPLGVYGGGDESNLSSYLVGKKDEHSYLALDAGTIRAGINEAIKAGTFTTNTKNVLQDYIKGYFISHGHLDHLSGLIINSPDDINKPIYSLPFVIDILKNNYFTNTSWANFGNEGEVPIINKYKYQRITPGHTFPIEGTKMSAEVFTLSHVNPQLSSALLVNVENNYVLYFGDTGSDRIENVNYLELIWNRISPLIKEKKLKAILIEVSFPNSQPENKLFGHLTPKLLNEELQKLSTLTGKEALDNFNIIITHLKPVEDQVETIKKELQDNNPLQLNYIFPTQGKRISL
ncbi:3',5'-cyclic-nucleotide phosphodiesterase [Myroides injenensis]|uniref:3',5'-cyclic-nucleotide phosphodiesterase n=1 Tax=Myroides injenensis TaxID=1183151 RepID=UPI0002894D94|nr:3',5'-cyclic-nucleotide phosphodiesterase [Myroides injenensis]